MKSMFGHSYISHVLRCHFLVSSTCNSSIQPVTDMCAYSLENNWVWDGGPEHRGSPIHPGEEAADSIPGGGLEGQRPWRRQRLRPVHRCCTNGEERSELMTLILVIKNFPCVKSAAPPMKQTDGFLAGVPQELESLLTPAKGISGFSPPVNGQIKCNDVWRMGIRILPLLILRPFTTARCGHIRWLYWFIIELICWTTTLDRDRVWMCADFLTP